MPRPPPFVEADLLARASHAASADFHARLKARGVPVPAWRVLASLSGQDRPVGELARICLMQQPTMSRLLDRMAAEGLSEALIAEARAHEAAPALKALLRALIVPSP